MTQSALKTFIVRPQPDGDLISTSPKSTGSAALFDLKASKIGSTTNASEIAENSRHRPKTPLEAMIDEACGIRRGK